MKNITIIIPLIEYNKELLDRAINSVKTQTTELIDKVLLVYPESLKTDFINNISDDIVEFLVNTSGDTTFAGQINFAVDHINTEYFSVLEFDDEYSKIYFKNVKDYILEYPDVSVYLPITVETINGEFSKLINEFVWSKSFIEEGDFGFLTNKQLMDYTYFYISGGVVKTNDFKEVGKLKTKFKVTCVYEFLMRLTNNGKNIFVIPKIGYLHDADRAGSATKQFAQNFTKEEIKKEYELAKNEYLFN